MKTKPRTRIAPWISALVVGLAPLAQAAVVGFEASDFDTVSNPINGSDWIVEAGTVSWAVGVGRSLNSDSSKGSSAALEAGGGISQDLFGIVTGATYRVSFWAAILYGNAPSHPQPFTVTTAGLTLSSTFPEEVDQINSSSFNEIVGTFVGSSDPFKFQIAFASQTGQRLYLDDFSVSCDRDCEASPPENIPEPGTLALVGLAMAAIGASRRWSRGNV